MAKDVGKKFETDIFNSVIKGDNVDIFRIKDSIELKYVINVADFALYRKPTKVYLEAKSTKGKSISIGKIYKKDKKGNSYLYKYGRVDAKQVEKMIGKAEIKGVNCGFLLEFRGDYNHLVFYMTLQQFLNYVNDDNITRKSIHVDYLMENCLRLDDELTSKYWLNTEMDYLSSSINNGLDFNKCYIDISEWDRSKQSIRTKYNKIKKDGGYELNKKYIHYKYDLEELFQYVESMGNY
jgi:penicillin-binding protein-related factor A (putative recombinase)